MKEKLKCPWCGAEFSSILKLDAHARKHYATEPEILETLTVA